MRKHIANTIESNTYRYDYFASRAAELYAVIGNRPANVIRTDDDDALDAIHFTLDSIDLDAPVRDNLWSKWFRD